MATDDLKIRWVTEPSSIATTDLHSLADSNIWNSGPITDANPSFEFVRISYRILFNATPVAGDSLIFGWAISDEDPTNPIWPGDIPTSAGQITNATKKAEAEAGVLDLPVHQHPWKTSHGTTFKGYFDIYNFGPVWQLCVKANGEAIASSGALVTYRYGTTQRQS